MDNQIFSLLSFSDLPKSFDSVNHSILLNKCAKLDVYSFWLNSYLVNRTQSVQLNNTITRKANVPFRVHQGTIMGPIFFSVYVNDISD